MLYAKMTTLSGSAIDLYKRHYRSPGKPRNRRRGASYSGGIGTASASISAWSPFHVRHNQRTAQQSAPPVLPDQDKHVCEHCGARNQPTMNVAAELPMHCTFCGGLMHPPSAEDCAFNAAGACPTCSGTGIMREVDRSALVPDESKSIDEGAGVCPVDR